MLLFKGHAGWTRSSGRPHKSPTLDYLRHGRATPRTFSARLILCAGGLAIWLGSTLYSSGQTVTENAAASRASVLGATQDPVASQFQSAPGDNLQLALQQTGSVVFRDTPLAEVILILSEQWNVNIVAGSQINGSTSGTFKNESLEKILDSMLTANGYRYRQIGNSLVVLSANDSNVGKPTFKVEVIDAPVGTEDLQELIDALKLEMSPEGHIQPIKAAGKLAIHDTPERIAAVKELLVEIVSDAPNPAAGGSPQIGNYINTNPTVPHSNPTTVTTPGANSQTISGALELRPQFMNASSLQEPLEMIVGEGNVSVIEDGNLLVVLGDASLHHKARVLLQQLDKPRPQVRITGYIYDVDLGEIERLGVDWNQRVFSQAVDANGVPRNLGLSQSGLLSPNPPNNAAQVITGVAQNAATTTTGAAGAAAGAAAAAADPTGGQFLFRTLNSSFELEAMIQALDETEGSRLLADPHVTVVDRHTASLGIVTEIPVQQLTQTQQGGSIGSTSFKEAGITLDVTPRIAADGTIEMEVTPEFSALSGFQAGNPIIDSRRASTVVRVSHGQALVIGGLRSKTRVEKIRGIPCLMDVKWVGKLFRMHTTDIRESELIVLIMPEIIGYCGGLPREMHALDITRRQLSHVQTAVDGAFLPDCGDPHCTLHRERPRIHNGMHDEGLIGNHDAVFVNPVPPALLPPPLPQLTPETPMLPSGPMRAEHSLPTVDQPRPWPLPEPAVPTPDAGFTPDAIPAPNAAPTQAAAPAAGALPAAEVDPAPSTTAVRTGRSRRVPAKPASYRR